MISSSLPSSAAPSILIKPGFDELAAEPPIVVWNPLFSAISVVVSVAPNADAS